MQLVSQAGLSRAHETIRELALSMTPAPLGSNAEVDDYVEQPGFLRTTFSTEAKRIKVRLPIPGDSLARARAIV